MLELGLWSLAGSGQVRSWVSVTDSVSDPVFLVFAHALLLLLQREYAKTTAICEIAVVLK